MPQPTRRTGHRTYKQRRKHTINQATHCALCGQPLDHTLTTPHPDSIEADHITPLANGGNELGKIQAVHRRCNLAKGKKHWSPTQNQRHGRQW